MPNQKEKSLVDDENTGFESYNKLTKGVNLEALANLPQEVFLESLVTCSPIEYDKHRKDAAKLLKCRVDTLDKEVEKLRNESTRKPAPAKDDSEPHDEPVDGAELADLICKDITTHIVLPVASAVAITLWVLLTYVYDAFRILPILAILSPEKRCGKTTLLSLLNGLVNNGMMASNISSAAVYRVVEKYRPTLLTDEADTFFKNNEELRGIYNSGHNREAAYVIRSDKETLDPVQFSTWAPKAIAMIVGKTGLPDTIADRSFIVNMNRKKSGEGVHKKKLTHYEDNIPTRRKAKRWAEDNFKLLRLLEIDVPDVGNDRLVDNWTPVLTIAEHIGNGWKSRGIKAMQAVAGAQQDDESVGSMLLQDIQCIFQEINSDRISSEDLVNKLVAIEDRPWPEWRRGNPLSKTGLARLLKQFSIKPKSIRIGSITAKGYEFEKFKETFSRYIPPSQSVTLPQGNNISDLDDNQTVTRENGVTDEKQDNHPESLECYAVTVQKGGTGGKEKQVIRGAL